MDSENSSPTHATINITELLQATRNEIYVFDFDSLKFLYANDRALGNTQYMLEELLHLTPLDLKPEFERADFNKLIEPLRRGEKETLYFHTQHERKDGSLYPIDVWLQATSKLQSRAFIAIITDTSDLETLREHSQETQDHYLNIIDSITDGIVTSNAQGIIQYCNPALYDIFGYDADELIGQNVSCLAAPDIAKKHPAHIQHYLRTQEPGAISRRYIESCGVKRSGERFPIRISTRVIDNHGLMSFVATIVDITDSVTTERALRRHQKMDSMGHMVGGLAHDLNNILNMIQGNVELLELAIEPEPEPSKRIDNALKNIDRASHLIRRLLVFSRQESYNTETLQLNQVIRELAPLLEKSLTHNIILNISCDDELSAVHINAGDFEDSLVNLVNNAHDAIQEGSSKGTIFITAVNVTLDNSNLSYIPDVVSGDYVMISVLDNGCGIAPELKDKVMDPFYTTKDRESGTGLGLSLVYGFVRSCRGYMHIESTVNQGTNVIIYLPCKSAIVEGLASDRNTHKAESEAEEAPAKQHKILIVDDEADLLQLLQSALEQAGHEVAAYESPVAALEQMKHHHYDLLITDVIMPNMTGYELAKEARDLYPKLPIILVSGFSEPSSTPALAAPLIKISKPYSLTGIKKHISQLLSS